MADIKRTQKEIFAEMVTIFKGMNRTDLVEFCEKKISQVEKKATSTKETAKDKENAAIKVEILDILGASEKPLAIAEIIAQVTTTTEDTLTNQRISALLTQLGEKGTKEVVKTYDKKKAYFSIA